MGAQLSYSYIIDTLHRRDVNGLTCPLLAMGMTARNGLTAMRHWLDLTLQYTCRWSYCYSISDHVERLSKELHHKQERKVFSRREGRSCHRLLMMNTPALTQILFLVALVGWGRLEESLEFMTGFSAPIIQIMRASYGNFDDATATKVFLMSCASVITCYMWVLLNHLMLHMDMSCSW